LRILWINTELLHPIDKGGRIRTYHTLKELKRNHHITYLTLDDGTAGADARERAAEYCDELISVPHRTHAKFTTRFYADLARNLVSPLPYFITKYRSARMRREIGERARFGAFDVLVCDFLMSSVNVPQADAGCATVLFQHNVEAMIRERQYKVQTNPLKKVFLYNQWRKAHAYERAACHRFEQIIAVSPQDADVMRSEYEVERVTDVPTGVDISYFYPSGALRPEPRNLVFTGSMDWLPNEDAISYFTKEIMPLIKRLVPEVTLTVVGRNPFPSLVELSRRDPSVIVTGRVDDVRPFIERAAAYIVPLRVGGGTRIKIYEAMAMEKAIVSTTVGAEGLPARDGVELLLADTPEAFAERVVRVITDDTLARELGTRAASMVRERFGWDRVAASFAEVCESAVRLRRSKKPGEGLGEITDRHVSELSVR
jgi:glycosyltransferase involved in cell wall biosynthesis